VLAAPQLQPPIAERAGDQPGLGFGLRHRQPGLDARPEMAGGPQVGVAQDLHPLGDVGQEGRELLGQVGSRCGLAITESGDHGPGDRPVALVAGMDAVGRKGEGRVLLAASFQGPRHRAVDIDHEPAPSARFESNQSE